MTSPSVSLRLNCPASGVMLKTVHAAEPVEMIGRILRSVINEATTLTYIALRRVRLSRTLLFLLMVPHFLACQMSKSASECPS